MHYEGNIFRPPSEADSILFQVTTGCSHNKCTFSELYKDKKFQIKYDDRIMVDIDYSAGNYQFLNRLFICDGDALIVPQKKLLKYLDAINKKLPWIKRIGIYANSKSIEMKTSEELKDHGINIAYFGLESGNDVTLKNIKKHSDSEKMIKMGGKIRHVRIKLSITVLLGIAERESSEIHARGTGRVLSAIDPEYVGALSLMLSPSTVLHDEYMKGDFPLIPPEEMLNELKIMLEHTNLTNGLFHANHASNYLPVKAKLPEDKEKNIKRNRLSSYRRDIIKTGIYEGFINH